MNTKNTTEETKTPMLTQLIGFPGRYKDLQKPTDGPWHDSYKKALDCLRSGAIVLMFGDRGTGKSFMSYALARQSQFFKDTHYPPEYQSTIKRRRPAIYRTAMEVFISLRNSFRKDAEESELEIIEELSGAVLLVIDEIQERGETRWEDQKLTAIVDARYREMRPTLLIGNFSSVDEFTAGISPSISNRIMEGGGAIHCNWPSFRTRP